MSPEQGALLQKARDSLRAARLLVANGLHNFAASRAYYAFYVAEACLLEHGQSFSRHSAVIAAFGGRFAKPGLVPAEFDRYLLGAQESRNVADYDIGPGLSEVQAVEHISRAEQFIRLAEQRLGALPVPGA